MTKNFCPLTAIFFLILSGFCQQALRAASEPAEGVAEDTPGQETAGGDWSEGVGSDGEAGKTLEESFERVSVKAMPEPSEPAEGVAAGEADAQGEASPSLRIELTSPS